MLTDKQSGLRFNIYQKQKYLSFLYNKIICILKLPFLMLPSLVQSTICFCFNQKVILSLREAKSNQKYYTPTASHSSSKQANKLEHVNREESEEKHVCWP